MDVVDKLETHLDLIEDISLNCAPSCNVCMFLLKFNVLSVTFVIVFLLFLDNRIRTATFVCSRRSATTYSSPRESCSKVITSRDEIFYLVEFD